LKFKIMKKTFTAAAVVTLAALSVAGYGALFNHRDQSNSAASTETSMAGDAMHDQMTSTEIMSGAMAGENMSGAMAGENMSGAMAGENMAGAMTESPAMESQMMADAGMMTKATSMSKEGQSMSNMMASDSQTMTPPTSNTMVTTPVMAQ
jgi:hypothetical protein